MDLSGRGQKAGKGAALAEGTGQTEAARDEHLAAGSEHRSSAWLASDTGTTRPDLPWACE